MKSDHGLQIVGLLVAIIKKNFFFANLKLIFLKGSTRGDKG